MSPLELVDKLEQMGIIEARVLKKLRREVDNPEKNPSIKGVLTYLVKKGHLTKDQAKKLKREAEAPQNVIHEELEVNQPAEDGVDTDDLTANIAEAAPSEKEEKKSAKKKKKSKRAPEPEIEAVEEVLPEPVKEIEEVQAVAQAVADEYPDTATDPFADPLMQQEASGDPGVYQSQVAKTAHGFKGKIDKSDQWSTKWLYIAFGTLGFLLLATGLLYFAVGFVDAENLFAEAMKSYDQGAYSDAIEKFEKFEEQFPSHEKAPTAKVRRVQALLASTFETKNWDETINRAENQLPPLLEDDTIDSSNLNLIRDDLGLMLPKSTWEIAKRAVKQKDIEAMKVELQKANAANVLCDTASYIPANIRKKASVTKMLENVTEEIARGKALIKKQEDYKSALAEIQSLRSQQKTDEAFKRYNRLIRDYGDLAAVEELQTEMKAVSDQERELVTTLPAEFNIATSPRQSAIAKSVVLASRNGQALTQLKGRVIPVLADGSLFGIDVGDGSVAWRKYVGVATRMHPVELNSEVSLAADQQNHDLMSIQLANGQILWRAEIGEPFQRPTVSEKQIVVTTDSGKIISLDPASGKVRSAIQLPKSTSTAAVISDRNPVIYQPGSYANLYTLSSEDLSCQDVYYLGQAPNSISVPPVIWSSYVVVPVNRGDFCDLKILKPQEQGVGLTQVQTITKVTNGIVTSPLMRFGRWMLIASETGDMKILELNLADETNPVRTLVTDKFENREANQFYMFAEGSQLWIGSRGLARHRMQRAQGQIERETIENHSDYFLGPIRKFGDNLIHIRQRGGSAHVSVSAVEPLSLKEIWRTDLSGPLAGTPLSLGNTVAAISSQGDLFSVDAAAESAGTTGSPSKSSTIVESLMFDETLDFGDGKYVCTGPAGRSDVLMVDLTNNVNKHVRMQSPANKTACRPVRRGDQLIVASARGQVCRVDPSNGRVMGTPFLTRVKPGETMSWTQPAVVSDELLVIGGGTKFFALDASKPRSLKSIGELEVEGMVQSPSVASGGNVFAVIGGEAGSKLLSISGSTELSVGNSVDLPAGYVAGPWLVGDQILLQLENEQLVSFDSGLNQKWTTGFELDQLAAPPADNGGNIVLTFRSGRMVTINAGTGEPASNMELGQPIIHRPLVVGDKVYFAGLDGTLHITNTQ